MGVSRPVGARAALRNGLAPCRAQDSGWCTSVCIQSFAPPRQAGWWRHDVEKADEWSRWQLIG